MFTKDMLLIDVFRKEGVNLEAMAETLANFGMHCLGCELSRGETVEEAAYVHGVDPEVMVNALNAAAVVPVEE